MPRPEETLRSGSDASHRPDPSLHLRVPADLMAPARARRAVTAWLRKHRWPEDPSDDLVLVISEAVSNSVEHGYGVLAGSTLTATAGACVEVVAEIVVVDEQRHIVVTVRDEGVWRPPPADRGNRRHGLPLMRACSAEVTVDGTSHGTTLTLRSHPVPA